MTSILLMVSSLTKSMDSSVVTLHGFSVASDCCCSFLDTLIFLGYHNRIFFVCFLLLKLKLYSVSDSFVSSLPTPPHPHTCALASQLCLNSASHHPPPRSHQYFSDKSLWLSLESSSHPAYFYQNNLSRTQESLCFDPAKTLQCLLIHHGYILNSSA